MFIQIKEKRFSASPIQLFYPKFKGENEKYYTLVMRINGQMEYFYFESEGELLSIYTYLQKLMAKDFILIKDKMYKKSLIKAYEYLGCTPMGNRYYFKLITSVFPKGESIFFDTEKKLQNCLELLDRELNVQVL